MVCLSSAMAGGNVRLFHAKDPETKRHFEWILKQDPIYGANVAYDMCVCMALWPDLAADIFRAYDEDRVIDVQLCQRLIDNAEGKMTAIEKFGGGYSLANIVKRLLKKDRSAEKDDPDAWRLRYAELYDVPLKEWPEAAVKYALDDAEDTLNVANKQWLHHRDMMGDAPAQARAALALQLMMCWGVMTDPKKIQQLREASEGMYKKLDVGLVKEGLVRKDGTRNVRAAQTRMLRVLRDQNMALRLTKGGYKKFRELTKDVKNASIEHVFEEDELIKYIAVDEEACNESGDDVLCDYSLRTQLHNILNTHIPDLLKGVNTPIQPNYKTMVESGRTSCSKSRSNDKKKPSPTNGFQFQNPKRSLSYFPSGVGIRECFVARPDKLFADNDFSGLESCTGAQACISTVGYSTMGDLINAGKDIHLHFGAKLMGITYEEALASERRCRDRVYASFPQPFRKPFLQLIHHGRI